MQFELLLTVLLMLSVTASGILKPNNISLIVSLPIHCIRGPDTSWKRGLEILSGAHVAVNGINKDSSVLSDYNLQLIVVDSGKDETKVVQQFVNFTFHQTPSDIVGITGFLSPKTVSVLLPLVRHKGLLLTAATDFLIPGRIDGYITMNSASAMVSVLLSFLKRMNWKHIGLIAENMNPYFFSVAETMLQTAKTNKSILTISPYIEMLHITSAIHELISHNTRVVVVSLHVQKAVQLLCVIYKKGLVWPHYAWIFHSYGIEDFLDQPANCDVNSAINGIFTIESLPQPDAPETKLISGITYSSYYHQYLSRLSTIVDDYNITLRPNRYAKLMYELVSLTTITLNESCYQGTSYSCTHQKDTQQPHRHYHDWTFSIFHKRKLKQVLISTMRFIRNSSITEVSFDGLILDIAPMDGSPVVSSNPPLGFTVGVSLQITLMAIFVTFMLLLYICFHKEPGVKATSFTLTFLMFAGCYINLLNLSLLHYFNLTAHSLSIQHQNIMCNLLLWLSAAGISLSPMLAILLVKMLRVYHIFNTFKMGRDHYCSDLSLAIYILLIYTPSILVNLIWTFIDRYQISLEYRTQNGNIDIKQDCSSKCVTFWSGAQSIYLLVLTVALALVAILTRKVRLQHFKDTKKVNILVFVLCLDIYLSYSYWLLLRILNTKLYIVNLPLHIGHSILIISFQGFLILPKVFPPLWQCATLHTICKCARDKTRLSV